MLSRTPLRAMLLIAIGALATLGACSDGGEELTGPPIPSLSGQSAGSGVTTVDAGPLNAGCDCAEWSCSSGVCGYDTANHLGACCVECTAGPGIPPTPKPFCDGGSGGGGGSPACSEQSGAGEWGVDFCTTAEQDPGSPYFDRQCVPEFPDNYGGGHYYDGSWCPLSYTCCYGGNYGDGPY